MTLWYSVLAPKHVPSDIVAAINKAIQSGMRDPNFAKQLDPLGLIATPSSPQVLSEKLAAELSRWGGVIKKAGIQID